MYFEAELKGIKYNVNVTESRSSWKVDLQTNNNEWTTYNIPKDDYKRMDDAVSFIFNNSSYMIDVVGESLQYTVYTRGSYRVIPIKNDEMLLHDSLKAKSSMSSGDSLVAGMPGKIVDVMVKKGQAIEEEQPLLIMEAMKMENEMRSKQNCKVKKVHVKKGDTVEAGATLITFDIK